MLFPTTLLGRFPQPERRAAWLMMFALGGACAGDNARVAADVASDSGETTSPDSAEPDSVEPETADTAEVADVDTTPDPATPQLEVSPARTLPVPTATGLPAITGYTVDARIQPHGLPARWWVEYGASEAYGATTAERALPGKLDAHFTEDWAASTNGWLAGWSGQQLVRHDDGGPDGGPFVRYTDEGGAGNDVNHHDGIGIIHLGPYIYPGNFYWAEVPPMYLGGGSPDFRGARVSVSLRGVDWVPNGTRIGSWIQGYRDHVPVEVLPEDSRYPNYAFTGDPQTDHLVSGLWEPAAWVFRNRTADWTFAGAYGGRLLYDYGELDTILGGVNVDFFLLQILKIDLNNQPSGSINLADMSLTYRQHSLTAASNGGALASEPAGGSGADRLTDGWRWGTGREWQSGAAVKDPQSFEYAFADPVSITSVNVVNATEHPSKDIEISVSEDGGANWIPITTGVLPDPRDPAGRGPNYAFFHIDMWVLKDEIAVWAPIHPNPVNRLKVTVTSGYDADGWGLGEIEAFGSGATETTDDDWYDVNQDLRVDPGTWHYRIVATSEAGTTYGPDQVVAVPATVPTP